MLIGTAVTGYICERGWGVVGDGNNLRADFFGPGGDTRSMRDRLKEQNRNYDHREIAIRDRARTIDLIGEIRPAHIVHAASQPSHYPGWSIGRPLRQGFEIHRSWRERLEVA